MRRSTLVAPFHPQVLCGRHHSALVVSWGAMYSWGACSFGKVSHGDGKAQGVTVLRMEGRRGHADVRRGEEGTQERGIG